MFRTELAVVVFTKVILLATNRAAPHLSGVGARTLIDESEFLYNMLGNPWLGYMDLGNAPLGGNNMKVLVEWLMWLRPQLAQKGLGIRYINGDLKIKF